MIAKWIAAAPYFQSVLRIVAAFIYFFGAMMKIFAFPMAIMPEGGTIPLMTQVGIGSLIELIGGALLIVGLFTRPVAFINSGMMAVAYWQFHAPQNVIPQVNNGIPAILYCFIWLYFSAAGAGPWSIDAKRT